MADKKRVLWSCVVVVVALSAPRALASCSWKSSCHSCTDDSSCRWCVSSYGADKCLFYTDDWRCGGTVVRSGWGCPGLAPPPDPMPAPSDTPEWYTDPFWGMCEYNGFCGYGTQTREVACRSQETWETLDDSRCWGLVKPPTQQECITFYCDWEYDSWSKCNKACGGGKQSRSATCGGGKQLRNCRSAYKEATSRTCNERPCPTPGEVPWVVGRKEPAVEGKDCTAGRHAHWNPQKQVPTYTWKFWRWAGEKRLCQYDLVNPRDDAFFHDPAEDKYMQNRLCLALHHAYTEVTRKYPAYRAMWVQEAWSNGKPPEHTPLSRHWCGAAVDVWFCKRITGRGTNPVCHELLDHGLTAKTFHETGRFDFVYYEGNPPHVHASTLFQNCYSAAMSVELEDGSVRTMAEIQVGDKVRVIGAAGQLTTDTIFLIGTATNDTTELLHITTEAGAVLEVTGGHYVHAAAQGGGEEDPPSCCSYATLMLAKEIRPADWVFVRSEDGGAVMASKVTGVVNKSVTGLYSPYLLSSLGAGSAQAPVLSSSILVNRVAGSHFTDQMSLIPTHGFPAADRTLDLLREIWQEDPRFSEALSREDHDTVSAIAAESMGIVKMCLEEHNGDCPHELVVAEVGRVLAVAQQAFTPDVIDLLVQGIQRCAARRGRGGRLLAAAASLVHGGSLHRAARLGWAQNFTVADLPEVVAFALENTAKQIAHGDRMDLRQVAAVSAAGVVAIVLGLLAGFLYVGRAAMRYRYRRFHDEEEAPPEHEHTKPAPTFWGAATNASFGSGR